MKKTWIVTEFEKFEDLIDVLGFQILNLEMENSRLRRRLSELRKEKVESATPSLRRRIKM